MKKKRIKEQKITGYDFFNFGLTLDNIKDCETLEDLKKQVPNYVVAKCMEDVPMIVNNKKTGYTLKKKNKYCMSTDYYRQLKNSMKVTDDCAKFLNIYKPYNGQDLTDKTLLACRTAGIGDMLFIQPCLRYLKEKYPTCTIKFACSGSCQEMIENWDCVDEVVHLPFSTQKFMKADYHAIFEGVIERTAEATRTNAYKLVAKWLNLDISEDQLIPSQKPIPEIVNMCRQILRDNKFIEEDFIIIQTRASSPIRSPNPKEFWKPLIELLLGAGHKIVLIDSPHKEKEIDEYIDTFPAHMKYDIFNFSGHSETLAHFIAITSLAKLCVSTDTSLMHIGASLNKKLFGVYGPFNGAIRLETYPNCSWVDSTAMCSPCFTHGYRPCSNSIGGFSECYKDIDVKECFDKIEILLKEEI